MPRRTPARYQWNHKNGNTDFLCESCCAYWRINAASDPVLEPLRIRPLEVPAADDARGKVNVLTGRCTRCNALMADWCPCRLLYGSGWYACNEDSAEEAAAWAALGYRLVVVPWKPEEMRGSSCP